MSLAADNDLQLRITVYSTKADSTSSVIVNSPSPWKMFIGMNRKNSVPVKIGHILEQMILIYFHTRWKKPDISFCFVKSLVTASPSP